MPWEEDESVSLSRRRGGLRKAGLDNIWTMTDLLTVTFQETVQCVLIPSREDIRRQGLNSELWYTDKEIFLEGKEAEKELLMTIPTNVSTLSLYAAMNLLYRPCSQKGKICHFNVLIVDDSVVARKMITLHLTQQHKRSGMTESLYIHHADNYSSALQIIKKKSFNVMIIDQVLGTSSGTWGQAKSTMPNHRDVSVLPKSALKGRAIVIPTHCGSKINEPVEQGDNISVSSALTGDDGSSQSSGLSSSHGQRGVTDSSVSPTAYLEHQNAAPTNGEGPWRDVASELGGTSSSGENSPVRQRRESATSKRSGSNSDIITSLKEESGLIKVASVSTQSTCSSSTASFKEVVSAVDNSSHHGYNSNISTSSNGSKSPDRDSVHGGSSIGYTTREDTASSSTNTSECGSGGNSGSRNSSKNRGQVLAPQPHRYHRSKDKRVIEWGAPSQSGDKQRTRGGWGNSSTQHSSENSVSSGDSTSHGSGQGISRNVDALSGLAPEKRELTVPHQMGGSFSTSYDVGDDALPTDQQPPLGLTRLTTPTPVSSTESGPTRKVGGLGRTCSGNLTMLMQLEEQKDAGEIDEDTKSIMGDAADIGATMARARNGKYLEEGYDDEEVLKQVPSSGSDSSNDSSSYRADSGQTSPCDENSGSKESSKSGRSAVVSSSWQKTPMGDAFEGRPSPAQVLSASTDPIDITATYAAATAVTAANTTDLMAGSSFPTVNDNDSVTDLLLNLQLSESDQVQMQVNAGMGLGYRAKNSLDELKSLAKDNNDQGNSVVGQGIHLDGVISTEVAHPHEVVVGVEGKLITLRSWEREPSDSNLSKTSTISAQSSSGGTQSTASNTPLRMSDLYKQKSPNGSSADLSVNTLNSHGNGRSIFESYKEPKVLMSDVDPSAWSGRDIIEVIREDTPCLIIGISSHIIDDNDEAYNVGTHTVSSIRQSNQLRSEFVCAGADLVWAKPIPANAWDQIRNVMPLEF